MGMAGSMYSSRVRSSLGVYGSVEQALSLHYNIGPFCCLFRLSPNDP